MLLMAPRRNTNGSSGLVHHQQQQQQQGLVLTTSSIFHINNHNEIENNNVFESINILSSISNNNTNNNIIMSPMQTSNANVNNHNHATGACNGNANVNSAAVSNGSSNSGHSNNSSSSCNVNGKNKSLTNERFTHCCYPTGECFNIDTLINLDDLSECVRIICNNENCNVGQYMHRDCFEAWEQSVLITLKSIGRARSWSDRQRSQNLWTKKGYDLVYKACVCKCGRGNIRKDLEWQPPTVGVVAKNGINGHYVNGNGTAGQQQRLTNGNSGSGGGTVSNGVVGAVNCNEDEDKKKKKKRNRNNQKPTLALTTLNSYHANGQAQPQQQQQQQQPKQQQNGHVNGVITNGLPNGGNSVSGSCSDLSPNPNVGVIGSGLHHNNNNNNNNGSNTSSQQQQQQNVTGLSNIMIGNGNVLGLDLRARAGSLSSSGGGSGTTSPSSTSHSSGGELTISPLHLQQSHHQQQQNLQLQQQFPSNCKPPTLLPSNGLSKSILNGVNGCTVTNSGALLPNKSQLQSQPTAATANVMLNGMLKHMSAFDQHLVQQQKNKEVEIYSERVRSTSGCNGIFSRRLDFSSFNLLPKTRLNSYQVKIEDEGNHGNDETRLFILSSLAQSQMSRVACILCEEPMLVFDRYPLVDGSFFLSPKQHSSGCIEVKYEGRALYLTTVCMGCLDSTATNRIISCRFCGDIWDGSNLVLGTMYAYDIFAAMPCCAERLKCNNCFKLLLHPQQRLNFFSDYSHCVTCPYCAAQDTHFVKPLTYCYTKSTGVRHTQIA